MEIIIKDITIELSTKNIIITYSEDPNMHFSTKKGLSPLIKADWDFTDQRPEIKPYRDIAWSGIERPINLQKG